MDVRRPGGAATKRRLRELLAERRVDEIVALAGRSRRVLGMLVALTFDAEPAIAWSAVAAMGRAAARIADDDPASVREHLRRLHWLMREESGAVCWRAPEAMAEIVAHRPALFADYLPIVVHLLVELEEEDLRHFRAGALWAIGRLGAAVRHQVADVVPAIVAALDDASPQVRGMAVWALARVGEADRLVGRSDLVADAGPVELFEGDVLSRTTVGALASTRRSVPHRAS
jgi:HEAT repeat protein